MIQSGLEGAGGDVVSRGFFSFGIEALGLRPRPGGRLRGRIIAQENPPRRWCAVGGTGSSCEPDQLSPRLAAPPLSSNGHARGRLQREASSTSRVARLAAILAPNQE